MSTMISQTDATLSPATTTTTDHHLHHQPSTKQSNQTTNLHNGKTPNGFSNNKKRKKFDETIIDGFAIVAFKSWEDLQDDLNAKISLSSANNTTATTTTNNNNNTINNTNNNLGIITDTNNSNNININNNNNETNNNTADKKSNSKSKQKCSSTSTTTSTTLQNSESNFLSTNSSASHNYKDVIGKIKKEKSAKKNSEHSQANPKDKRNKNNAERADLKKALEAKELAEKRLAIVQAKLKQEKMKNLNHIVNLNTNQIVTDQYTGPETPSHIIKEEIHSRSQNNLMNHDMLVDPIAAAKPSPYPPFQMSSQTHRTESVIHQTMQIHNPPSPPRQSQHHHHQHQKHPSLSHHNQPQHSPQPTPPQTQPLMHTTSSHTVHQSSNQQSPPPQPMQQHNIVHQHYSRQTPIVTPQTHPHLHQPPSLNSYSSQPSNAMIPPLGLTPLPSPYSCPTSIYITESISRQTSVIPQPAMGAALELPTIAGAGSRFGQPNVLHSMSQYTPQAFYHPMHYPMLPTERSFMELARNFTGPNHIVYPSLMNSFPTSSPSVTANPHSFVRWPRVPLDHHRAASRYNSLYQNAAAVPNRTYASFANSRPPTFPAGLFVSNIHSAE